ncbi:hypothetical protein PVA45_08075 (plasmid) [Entomospira entomophila]|uniref:GHMP kinase C-terminal domain-containing protein n=1 Tax=Entomospira entomophila TaxID=2719988 RepID=A0A968KTH9_9SPIO|nr:hypothetical protein [Entomospira entomophilus]NIZ41462.1 hypothetical protein [Entomospira entomophilus]WDI36296.1 hypothetical protein PVA45_08075 [Entomospira entomophilus]
MSQFQRSIREHEAYLRRAFSEQFDAFIHKSKVVPLLFFSPIPINIMGSAMEENGGSILPTVSSEQRVYALMYPLIDREEIHCYWLEKDERVIFSMDRQEKLPPNQAHLSWDMYLQGIMQQWLGSGKRLQGACILLSSDLPVGEGFGVEMAMRFVFMRALQMLGDPDVSWLHWNKSSQKEQALRLCLASQQDSLQLKGGLVDLYGIIYLEHARQAIYADTGIQKKVLIEIELSAYQFWVLHLEGVAKELQAIFHARYLEGQEALQAIQKHDPSINYLTELTIPQLEKYRFCLRAHLYQRVRFIIRENLRVIQMAYALESGDIDQIKALMVESARELASDYGIDHPVIRELIADLLRHPSVAAVRMTGELGSILLLLVQESDDVIGLGKDVIESYQDKHGIGQIRFHQMVVDKSKN